MYTIMYNFVYIDIVDTIMYNKDVEVHIYGRKRKAI